VANNRFAWPFYSWQNLRFASIFLAGVPTIAIYDGRVPQAAVMPESGVKLVKAMRRVGGLAALSTRVGGHRE